MKNAIYNFLREYTRWGAVFPGGIGVKFTKMRPLLRRGGGGALRGRFLLRPLRGPMRTWESRRGGSGVDEAGGRLRRPGQAVRNGLQTRVPRESRGAGACGGRPGRRKRPPSTPLCPRPYAVGGGSPKTLPLRAGAVLGGVGDFMSARWGGEARSQCLT